MTAPSSASAGPPALIYVIRHGEKPADPPTPTAPPSPPFGVDINGNQSIHSLLPRGWQRSGALAVLFAPALGPPQAGLSTLRFCSYPTTGLRTRRRGTSGHPGAAVQSSCHRRLARLPQTRPQARQLQPNTISPNLICPNDRFRSTQRTGLLRNRRRLERNDPMSVDTSGLTAAPPGTTASTRSSPGVARRGRRTG